MSSYHTSNSIVAASTLVKPIVMPAELIEVPAGLPTSAGVPASILLPATVTTPITTRKPMIQALSTVTSGNHSLSESMLLVGNTAKKFAGINKSCFSLRQSLLMKQVNCTQLGDEVLSSLEAIQHILAHYPNHQLSPHVQLWAEAALECNVVGLDLRSLFHDIDVVCGTAMLSQFWQQFKMAVKTNLQTTTTSLKKVRQNSEKQVNNLIKWVQKSREPFRVMYLDLCFIPQPQNGFIYPHPDEYTMMDYKTRFTKIIQTHFNEMYLGGVYKLLSNSQNGTCFRVLMIFDEKLAAENLFMPNDIGTAWVVTLPEGVGGFRIQQPIPYQAATHLAVNCDDSQSLMHLH